MDAMCGGEMVYSQSRSSLDINNLSKVNTRVTTVVAWLIEHFIDLLDGVVKCFELLQDLFTESRRL